MSIFKETFPKFVQDQLTKRGEILSSGIDPITGEQSGQRSDDFYTYTLNKQCWLSLASGVEVIDETLLEDIEILRSQEKLIKKEYGYWGMTFENTVDISKSPAYAYILKNGPYKGGFASEPEIKEGTIDTELGQGTTMDDVKVKYYKGAYGGSRNRGDAKDGFGIVPNPGIIDAQVRTKSAYGSLREGKVKFVCHNKRQLSILELLYMRPGYTLLLEWGWSPYIDNDGEVKQGTSDITGKFLDKNNNYSIEDIENAILEKKEETGGNYDALIGYCKNFSYSLRDDGGYNCETEIIAKGEVIESLKEVQEYGEEIDPAENVHPIEELLNDIISYQKFTPYFLDFNFLEKVGLSLTSQAKYAAFFIAKGVEYKQKTKNKYANALSTNTVNQTYVRWDAFAYALNELIPKKENGQSLFQLQTYHIQNEDTDTPYIEPLLYGHFEDLEGLGFLSNLRAPYPEQHYPMMVNAKEEDTLNWNHFDCSTNPNVCIMPRQFYEIIASGLPDSAEYRQRQKHPVLYEMMKQKTSKTVTDRSESSRWYQDKHRYKQSIGETMLCAQFLLKKFKEMYYDMDGNPKEGDDADFSIFKYVEAIWDGVQNATRGHDLKLNTDNRPGGDIVRIIDMSANSNELNRDNIHELKIQSLDSCVREVVYNTTIPSALSSTIAIAAQSPDSISDLDKVSFAAINRGIQDKFSRKYVDSDVLDQETQDKYNQRFDKALEDLSLALFSGEFRFDRGPMDYETKIGYLLQYNIMSFFTEDYYENYEDDEIGGDVQTKLQKGVVAQRKKAEKAISVLRKCYASTNEEAGYYRGQYVADASPQRSAIIPLKFNAKMDGISGLIIGNVFKLPASKLPDGYGADDVFFIVMGEEQSITNAQDWTTTISGHLILLGGETPNKQKQSWENADIGYKSKYTREQEDKGKVDKSGGANYDPTKTAAPSESSESEACRLLVEKNNELRERISGRTGTYKDSNKPANVPRHELPGGKEQCVVTTGANLMKTLVPLLKGAGYTNPEAAAAGIVGNIKYEGDFGITRYGDNGNAVGLCQWNGTRFDSLVATGNWDTEVGQINYLMKELGSSEKAAGEVLKTAKNATEAALAFLNEFERSAKANNAKAAGKRYEVGGTTRKGANVNSTTGKRRADAANGYYNDYVNANPDIKNVNEKDVPIVTTDDKTVGGNNLEISTAGSDAFRQQHGPIQGYMIKDGTIPDRFQQLYKAKGAINFNLYIRVTTETKNKKQYIKDFLDKKSKPYNQITMDGALYLNYTHYYTSTDKRSTGGILKRVMIEYKPNV